MNWPDDPAQPCQIKAGAESRAKVGTGSKLADGLRSRPPSYTR